MSKFVIREVKSGIKFDLKATNGQTILSSEVYSSMDACRKGIESVRKSAPRAHLENQTEPDRAAKPHPKFEMYADRSGEFRFRLKSRNGKIIGISDGYAAKSGCLNGIESVKKNAADAEVEEM